MATGDIEARVIQKVGTEAEWNASTILPREGEFMIVADSSGTPTNIKVGNGVDMYPALPYMFDAIQQNVNYYPVNTLALPTPAGGNVFSIVVEGDYTFGGVAAFTVPVGNLGVIFWDGSVWALQQTIELPTPPLTSIVNQDEDKAITPKGVDDALMTVRTETPQLLGKSTFVYGYYDADGNPQASTATIRTPKINIEDGQTLLSISDAFTLGAAVLYRIFFYGSDGVKLPDPDGRILQGVTNLQGLSIPALADTWAMNLVTEAGLGSATDNIYSNTIMANYGATSLPYEAFGYNVKGNNIDTLTETVNEVAVLFSDSVNLIDKSTVAYGYWNASGTKTSSVTSISTQKIPIDASKGSLSLNANYPLGVTNRFNFWDSLGAHIGTVSTSDPIQNVPIPVNAATVSVNITSQPGGVGDPTDNQYVNSLQLEYGPVSTAFQSYGRKLVESALPNVQNNGVSVEIISADSFVVTSYHDNGKSARHYWVKNNKAPQYDTAWRATEIEVGGQNIAQGQFNWIHLISDNSENGGVGANEGQHVGSGHGCETLLRANFYIDGKEFVVADSIGQTLYGNLFHFDIATVIYAADSAETQANWDGANVVPQLPLIESTNHYMVGEIGANSKTKNRNKLVVLRDGTVFGRCYMAMQLAYRTHFDRLEVLNIENTMNDIQTLTPIDDSTAALDGLAYDTAEGWRGELALEAIAYSDRFGYVLKTRAFPSTEVHRLQSTIQVEPSTSKCYFHPVVTSSLASLRSIPVDVFNRGDIIAAYVERELYL